MSTDTRTSLSRWRKLFWFLGFSVLLSPYCYAVYVIAWDEVYGTTVEFISRYRDSQFIYRGYGVYGSTDYGIKIYVRWTADDAESVKKHYDRFPDSWQARVIPVAEVDYDNIDVCYVPF